MSVFGSYLFYIFGFSIVLLCFLLGRKKPMLNYIGLCLILSFTLFRFDVGYDYSSYYEMIQGIHSLSQEYPNFYTFFTISTGSYYLEPFFILLSYVTAPLSFGPILVIGFYGLISILLLYKTLKPTHGLFGGFLVVFLMGYLFVIFDQIRQAASMAVLLYSLKYVQTRNLRKYLLCVFVGFLFHTSILLVAPFIYLLNFKPRIKYYNGAIILSFILLVFGFWGRFQSLIFSLTPLYRNYADSEFVGTAAFGTGLGLLLKVVFYMILMNKVKKKCPLYANLIFLGIILLLVSSGNLNINRFSNYFCFTAILAFPLIFKKKNKISVRFLVFLMLIYGANLLKGEGANGCVPYDHVFSDSYSRCDFRDSKYE